MPTLTLPPSATPLPILKILASVNSDIFFKKTVSDSNAPVQDKALDALIAYLKAADADDGRSEQDKEPEQEVAAEAVGSGPTEKSAADVPQEIDEYELVDPVDILTPLEKPVPQEIDEYELVDPVDILTPLEKPVPQEIDEYELVDPVDILTPLEKTGFWNGEKATKWSERKDAVAELTKLASTKRIAPGDFTEICRTLKKLVTDVNIAGAVEAVQAIGNQMKRLASQPPGGAIGPTDWNEALDIITYGSPEQSVEGMKFVCHELAAATNDPEGSLMDDLVKDADRLVSCLATKVAKTFDFSLTGASSRAGTYVLNTLMQVFQNKRLAHAVNERTLDNLITELLLWLLDERVPRMDDGSQLLKALNVLMLKILDNAERTSSFVVLINLLKPLDPSRWPSPPSNESFATRNMKFSDLVVKCLIKLTKVLQSTINEVDLDRILQSVHVYLQELGVEEIRRRAGVDDKPLRMVKTVLHELLKLRGTAIKGHLSMVPIDMEPQPIILAYINLSLKTMAAARMLMPTGPVGQTHWGDSMANNPMPASHCSSIVV